MKKSQGKSWIRTMWEGWMAFARVVGTFNARVLLTLFYFVVVGPFSLAVGRWQNYLKLRPPEGGTTWLPVASKKMNLEEARKQS